MLSYLPTCLFFSVLLCSDHWSHASITLSHNTITLSSPGRKMDLTTDSPHCLWRPCVCGHLQVDIGEYTSVWILYYGALEKAQRTFLPQVMELQCTCMVQLRCFKVDTFCKLGPKQTHLHLQACQTDTRLLGATWLLNWDTQVWNVKNKPYTQPTTPANTASGPAPWAIRCCFNSRAVTLAGYPSSEITRSAPSNACVESVKFRYG